MTLEQKYSNSTSIAHRKYYAQFFTPAAIAKFMCEWVVQGRKKFNMLEPAYGLGIFSRIMSQNHKFEVDAYEIDEHILKFVKSSKQLNINLINDDYLQSNWSNQYDVILCNPPYLKFHDYNNSKLIPLINDNLGTNLNGFSNIYTLFILKSLSQLRQGGRMSYIVPCEFLNSDYGVEVKKYLIESRALKHIIVFDFTQNAFDDALTTSCILLFENNSLDDGIKFSNVSDINQLELCLNEYVRYDTDAINPEIKWKFYYDKTNYCKYKNLVPFSSFAKVKRGIATGANSYFTFNQSKIDDFNLPTECMMPCICKVNDVKKIFFTDDDYKNLVNTNKTVFIFNALKLPQNKNVIKYICLGEDAEINRRHLTSSRSPWYSIEKRLPSPIWVSVFNRNGLKFIRNEAGIYNLTNFHCVYVVNSNIDVDVLFSYLITDVAKEIFMDNSRQYGNGLIKFEPNDLNKGMVVDLSLLNYDECCLIKDIYNFLKRSYKECYAIRILNSLFYKKFTTGKVNIKELRNEFDFFKRNFQFEGEEIKQISANPKVKQLNFVSLYEQYADSNIIENTCVCDGYLDYNVEIDTTKNVLISLIKNDNINQYIDRTAKIYYTGKKFPASVNIENLYYFVPYIKNKGIRDLYLIKFVRLGLRKEGQEGEDKDDIRLVFEVEFKKQLYDDYKPIKLNIWNAFKDTKLEKLLESTYLQGVSEPNE